MDLHEAIRTRRSIGKVKEDEVPKALIEDILEAATWAPNHFRTEPWRFYVMTGAGRDILGNAYADIALEKAVSSEGAELSDADRAEMIDKEQRKAKRAPVVIAVSAMKTELSPAPLTEELAATHAAVQNMLLTIHAHGLGAIWRSGDPMYHPKMHEAFKLQEGEQLVGLIYIGYPDREAPEGKRTPFEEKTVWLS